MNLRRDSCASATATTAAFGTSRKFLIRFGPQYPAPTTPTLNLSITMSPFSDDSKVHKDTTRLHDADHHAVLPDLTAASIRKIVAPNRAVGHNLAVRCLKIQWLLRPDARVIPLVIAFNGAQREARTNPMVVIAHWQITVKGQPSGIRTGRLG